MRPEARNEKTNTLKTVAPDVSRWYASRDKTRAQEAASRFGGAGHFESYDAALASREIDVVLIGLPPASLAARLTSLRHPVDRLNAARMQQLASRHQFGRLLGGEELAHRGSERRRGYLVKLPDVANLVHRKSENAAAAPL